MVKSQDYIYIANKQVYYIPSIVGLFPNINNFQEARYDTNVLNEEIIKRNIH